MRRFLLLSLLTAFASCCFGQQFISVVDEELRLNSQTSLTGNTRNGTRVPLPEKCIGYVYRLTVQRVEGTGVSEALFELLKRSPEQAISWGASLVQYAVNNADGEAVDAFIFNNTFDSDNFLAKNDGNWSACKTMLNRMNICLATKECQGTQMYFGFRNNNIRQGLKVRLEVVAVVDTASTTAAKYSYHITNNTQQKLNYQLSTDNVNWQNLSLEAGYMINPSITSAKLYFKISTTALKFVSYELQPGTRYKIIWNASQAKWDLVQY
jgi:hypothetical protein